MSNSETGPAARPKGGVPRGLKQTGPVLFSYGFRPFFLGAGLWAVAAMALWISALVFGLAVGGTYGAAYWHMHEMLFGFAPAVLAGFLLTAVPNWTGRLPVAGRPLMLLFGLWCAGRLALLMPGPIGLVPAVAVDGLFVPALFFVCAREVVAGRKWKDLKVLVVLALLALGNIGFHWAVLTSSDPRMAARLAIAAYVVLVTIMGGRIIPSFTRNWLNQKGVKRFPLPFGRFDTMAIGTGAVALAGWAAAPAEPLLAPLALIAAGMHTARLMRWRGMGVYREKLLFVMHVAYAFVPGGLLAITLGAQGLMPENAVTHVLTVGAVAAMMLAVMTRATRGHTGRVLTASATTTSAYVAIVACALVRPLADLAPDHAMTFHAAAGLLWIAAFGLFLVEYGPMLALVRRNPMA